MKKCGEGGGVTRGEKIGGRVMEGGERMGNGKEC